jgi:hypothetical protein
MRLMRASIHNNSVIHTAYTPLIVAYKVTRLVSQTGHLLAVAESLEVASNRQQAGVTSCRHFKYSKLDCRPWGVI